MQCPVLLGHTGMPLRSQCRSERGYLEKRRTDVGDIGSIIMKKISMRKIILTSPKGGPRALLKKVRGNMKKERVNFFVYAI
jgi:hypothetical protein